MASFLRKSLLTTLLIAGLCAVASASDLTFHPRITATTEYNDNVEEENGGEGDFVGILRPGMSLLYDHSRVLLDVSYDFEHKRYVNQVLSDEYNNYLDANLNLEAVKDLFYIDVRDSYSKVYEAVPRGDRPDGDTSNGTTDQNIFSLRPYFSFAPQERTTITTGGELKDIWYSEEGNVDKRIYSLFADMNHELTDRLSAQLGVGFDRQDPPDDDGGFDRYSTTFGSMYTYAEGSYVKASVSPTYTDFELDGSSDKWYMPYSLSLVHAVTDTLEGTAYTSMEFTEDPTSAETLNQFVHGVGLTHAYKRGRIGVKLEYRDYEETDTANRTTYWRPSLQGAHELTERLGFDYNVYTDFHTNPDSNKYIFLLTSLRYSLSEEFSCSVNYRFKDNDDERSESDYVSNTLGLSLLWTY